MINILLCRCISNKLYNKDVVNKLIDYISSFEVNIYDIDDLCGLSVINKEQINKIFNNEINIILSCYDRSIKSLTKDLNVDFNKIKLVNIHKKTFEEIQSEINDLKIKTGKSQVTTIKIGNDWIPWFPVIDYSRCSNCKQCLNFCLFGVYSRSDDGKIKVTQPKNCKTNCPACARICPSIAIIFPKHNEAPINGDEITNEENEKNRVKIDMQKLLGDDPYKTLLERRLKNRKNSLLKN